MPYLPEQMDEISSGSRRNSKKITVKNQAKLDKITQALPGTIAEIAKRVGMGKVTVWRWIQLLVELEQVHVYKTSFAKYGGFEQQHFALGKGTKPPKKAVPKTPEELDKKRREKERRYKELEKKEFENARQKALTNKPKVDILTAHFFGKVLS